MSVSPVGDGECSDKAQVVATTKVAGLHSAVIFAEDVSESFDSFHTLDLVSHLFF